MTRSIAFSGNYSAVLSSHDKDVQPNLSGSAVQAVLAEPYVGTRVELSAVLRVEGHRGAGGSLWIYVTDPARVVIAYQIVAMALEQPAGQWARYRIVMDIPWHGEVMAYGFSLQGKGKLWADDVKLAPVDINVPITGTQNSHQLGVIAQAVSLDGALANPINLDFEDTLTTRERQPEAPPDSIRGTRYWSRRRSNGDRGRSTRLLIVSNALTSRGRQQTCSCTKAEHAMLQKGAAAAGLIKGGESLRGRVEPIVVASVGVTHRRIDELGEVGVIQTREVH